MPRFFALVPAAGGGSRMASEMPKQYLPLAGKPLIHHALACLAAQPDIECVFVVLAPDDTRFQQHDCAAFAGKVEPLYCGGPTRAASVFNGLMAVRDIVEAGDWVLVHDAARPCLGAEPLVRLMREAAGDDGGLLAVPVADTLKRADADGRVVRTEPREGLWQAQTPQMFRYGVLTRALHAADPAAVTDEASAAEALGLKPKLVMGDARNLKVTYPHDLQLAELILAGKTS